MNEGIVLGAVNELVGCGFGFVAVEFSYIVICRGNWHSHPFFPWHIEREAEEKGLEIENLGESSQGLVSEICKIPRVIKVKTVQVNNIKATLILQQFETAT